MKSEMLDNVEGVGKGVMESGVSGNYRNTEQFDVLIKKLKAFGSSFKMAKENALPLLPVTLVDTGKRLSKTKWALTPGVTKVIIHPLQTPESFADKTAMQLRDEIHGMIESALQRAHIRKPFSSALYS